MVARAICSSNLLGALGERSAHEARMKLLVIFVQGPRTGSFRQMWQPLCTLSQPPAVQIQPLRFHCVLESRSHEVVQRARALQINVGPVQPKYRPRAA